MKGFLMQDEPRCVVNESQYISFLFCFVFLLFLSCGTIVFGQDIEHQSGNNIIFIKDLDSIANELKQIRDSYQNQDRLRKNAFVQGVLNPGNRKFTFATQDDKYRFDIEVLVPGGNGKSKRQTIHRLNDGKNFYSVNRDGIGINNLDNFLVNWRINLADRLYINYMPDLDGLKPVDECCDYILKHIREHKDLLIKMISSGQAALQIMIDGSLYTIEISGPMAEDGSGRIARHRLVLDSRIGYLPIEFEREETPEQGASKWKRTYRFKSKYQKVAPGVHFLLEGVYESRFLLPKGSRIEVRPSFNSTTKITKVKFGDIKIDDNYFEVDSLNVDSGSYVYDRRTQPALEYVYPQSNLSLKFLNETLHNSGALLAK